MLEEANQETEGLEARRELESLAEGRFGRIAPGLLAAHLMRVTEGGDWVLRRAAFDALHRRWGFARRDGLRVAERPRGSALGCYATRRKGQAERPYRTQLQSLSPVRASCDCPDYRVASLGLCKHVLVVLDDLHARPRKLASALDADADGRLPTLVWEPVRPLTGRGDWLERVCLRGPMPPSAGSRSLGRHFRARGGAPAVLRDAFATSPARRRDLVADLLRFARAGGAARKVDACAVDAALPSLLEEEHARLDAGVSLRRGELTRALRSLKQPLYPYQRAGVEHALREGSLLLADDMGLGKTAQAIATCHALFSLGRVRRGLLIVPAPLKHQWLREWQRFSDAPVQVVDGSPAERHTLYETTRRGFLIVNYEQLLRDLGEIQAYDASLVVLDEAQRIKNWATKTALYVKQLAPRYRLVLTGTPMENRLEELASIMQWVDRRALEPAWRLEPWHHSAGGARHLETLRERLRPRMLRRVRKDVLDQLPPRTDTRVPVELTAPQLEAHDDLDQPIASLVRTSKHRPLTQAEFLRLMGLLTMQRILCNGMALDGFEQTWPRLSGTRAEPSVLRGLFSPKLVEIRALLESLVVDQGRQVVVFSQWRRMLQLAHWAVADVLEARGLRAVFFTGQESQKRRTANVIDFHDDDAARLMFATDAGGVGLNLQRAASCCINLELPWNPAVLEQRIGRVYRLGQSQPVEVYNLVSEEGIESRIATLVGNKRALFDGLFDGDSDEVVFDQAGSFME
ncbi:MAG: DEAD/DEAH box helicase, partial [Myxococcales bacterium]|nr:DEAD/DEAH box helicase [Myxococcales bacterium]